MFGRMKYLMKSNETPERNSMDWIKKLMRNEYGIRICSGILPDVMIIQVKDLLDEENPKGVRWEIDSDTFEKIDFDHVDKLWFKHHHESLRDNL